ncbi:MAG: bifunctional adenosylcobinamide kinase/adenosylcobinamide-phosphate guanylyltransferase [Rhizomicrobium sp.]
MMDHPVAIGGSQATLVLGGARSGKSRYAEQVAMSSRPPWIYVATAESFDDEMTTRIAEHKNRRSQHWQTIDAPLDLAGALAALPRSATILVDCLTLWLSNLMLAERDIEAEIQRLEAAMLAHEAPLVLVSNEVGFGIVPDNALARRFRDFQGLLNQRVAARAGHVVLVVAGLPMIVKGQS